MRVLAPNPKGVILRGANLFAEGDILPETLKNRQEASSWQQKYDIDAPKVGDLAPDFELYDVHGVDRVLLSDFRHIKPVVLIFGSFT